jgi:hypothetical protein
VLRNFAQLENAAQIFRRDEASRAFDRSRRTTGNVVPNGVVSEHEQELNTRVAKLSVQQFDAYNCTMHHRCGAQQRQLLALWAGILSLSLFTSPVCLWVFSMFPILAFLAR